MTAEVAVLNKHAIALAADSAATVQSTGKIYSANKLLALSKRRPVGTMVYNASEFLGIPWESLIKRFRADRPKRTHDTMREWVDEFCQYLDVVAREVPDEVRDQDTIYAYARALSRSVVLARKALKIPLGLIPKEEFFPAIEQALAEVIEEVIKGRDGIQVPLAGCDADIGQFLSRHTATFDDYDTHIFSEHVTDIPNLISRREELIKSLVSHHNSYFNWSGLVIAGFGDRQWFPGIHDLIIGGTCGGKVRRWEKSAVGVNWNNQGRVMAFAQDDVVQSFMEGVYPDIRREMTQAIGGAFETEYPDLIMDLLTNGPLASADPAVIADVRGKLKDAGIKVSQGLQKRFKEESHNRHATPIMNSIGHLSKDELASLAESLVTTTSLKRRMHANTQENVGGAVDVAVISRTEGFIWIKRKHYFDPALNPSFTHHQADW